MSGADERGVTPKATPTERAVLAVLDDWVSGELDRADKATGRLRKIFAREAATLSVPSQPNKIDSRRTGNGPGYNGGPGGCDADKTGIDSSDHDAPAPSSSTTPSGLA